MFPIIVKANTETTSRTIEITQADVMAVAKRWRNGCATSVAVSIIRSERMTQEEKAFEVAQQKAFSRRVFEAMKVDDFQNPFL